MTAFELSAEQLEAATSANDHLLIIAPPGCGKTEVLAHRAAHQLQLLEPNQRVLALVAVVAVAIGLTRWFGEIGRALVGGLFFSIGHNRQPTLPGS